jgi:hypothetical protein
MDIEVSGGYVVVMWWLVEIPNGKLVLCFHGCSQSRLHTLPCHAQLFCCLPPTKLFCCLPQTKLQCWSVPCQRSEVRKVHPGMRPSVEAETFLQLMQLKFLRCQVAAGEAVGVLAAQSVGE